MVDFQTWEHCSDVLLKYKSCLKNGDDLRMATYKLLLGVPLQIGGVAGCMILNSILPFDIP